MSILSDFPLYSSFKSVVIGNQGTAHFYKICKWAYRVQHWKGKQIKRNLDLMDQRFNPAKNKFSKFILRKHAYSAQD